VTSPARTSPASVIVVGTGLIGTSVALALQPRGVTVWLADSDPAAARLAADIGAGTVLPGDVPEGPPPGGPADVAVLAVPPQAVAPTLARAQAAGLARWYTDVASVKSLPVRQARAAGCDMASFVPGHPLSGRERSGPAAARADLFLGRPWVICPDPPAPAEGLAAIEALARICGAEPVQVSAAEHDRWVALVSHAPHVLSAAMAARLADASDGTLFLAGQGLRDVTRIAAGDTGLWTQILAANPDLKVLAALLEQGGAGVARIPGKRGGPARAEAAVQVVIPDRPGELARLFQAAGAAGVNIEDIAIEHSPGLPVGVAELTVHPEAVGRLTEALAANGWPVRR